MVGCSSSSTLSDSRVHQQSCEATLLNLNSNVLMKSVCTDIVDLMLLRVLAE